MINCYLCLQQNQKTHPMNTKTKSKDNSSIVFKLLKTIFIINIRCNCSFVKNVVPIKLVLSSKILNLCCSMYQLFFIVS